MDDPTSGLAIIYALPNPASESIIKVAGRKSPTVSNLRYLKRLKDRLATG
jgi:hypothetical protein